MTPKSRTRSFSGNLPTTARSLRFLLFYTSVPGYSQLALLVLGISINYQIAWANFVQPLKSFTALAVNFTRTLLELRRLTGCKTLDVI